MSRKAFYDHSKTDAMIRAGKSTDEIQAAIGCTRSLILKRAKMLRKSDDEKVIYSPIQRLESDDLTDQRGSRQ